MENKSGRNVLTMLGYIFVPFIMLFSVWKTRKWTNPLRIAFTVWAVFMAVVVVEAATSNNNQSTQLIPPSKPTASTTSKSTSLETATNATATTTTSTVTKPTANQDDVAFLKAVNGIMYNTFIEATNVGEQMVKVGKSQESMGAFSDFIDTDRALWDQYLVQVKGTKPQDLFLLVTQQQIVDDLTKLQHGAQTMTDAASRNDVDTIVGAGQDMTVAFNEIKQGYSQAASQMSNYGIQPTWTPSK